MQQSLIDFCYLRPSMDLLQILSGAFIISILHALMPNHWLPVMAIGKKQHWPHSKIILITLLAGAVHAMSTIVIGLIAGLIGWNLSAHMSRFHVVGPAILIVLGLIFLYRHHQHRHFHIDHNLPMRGVIAAILLAMFLSPCLEIIGFFLVAGASGWPALLLLSSTYFFTTMAGMWLWIVIVLYTSKQFDWHKIEHSAGLITGIILILTGVFSLFFP